jgi:hypothetical protein
MLGRMSRFVISSVVLGALGAAAGAQPTTSPNAPEPTAPAPGKPAAGKPAAGKPAAGKPAPPAPAQLPAAGSELGLGGTASWPKLDWLYDVPVLNDAAGKVVIHWFCAPRVPACTDDLARIITLRDTGHVYIVAYLNGTRAQAQKLDPIRESEGVGRGTVAFGRGATRLMKDLGVTGPASIVVDVAGKVELVTTGGTPAELDARDARVTAAAAAIKEYVALPDGPKQVKAGDRFALSISIQLATWLTYSDKTPRQLTITAPRDIKCDATSLAGDQIKIAGRELTASVTCSGPRGIYEARGELRFGYDAPGGGTGIGAESAQWKFEIKN